MITVSTSEQISSQNRLPAELAESVQVPTLFVEWDRAPGAVWALRLCECFGANGERWEYPPSPGWKVSRLGEVSYLDEPISTDASRKGTASVNLRTGEDELHFTVTAKNTSMSPWRDAWCWICLIHRYANSFQANCELPAGFTEQPWVPCASLRAPRARWLKWCPLQSRREIADRIARHHLRMWQPHVEAKTNAVRAWRMSLKEHTRQIVTLSSPDTVILGWSHWPCTDLGLFLGTLESQATASVEGTLRFSEESYEPA